VHEKRIPEAEIEGIEGRIQVAIKDGFPEVGWEGDPLLSIGFDRVNQQWLIRDHAFSPPEIIIAKKYNGIRDLDFRSLCERLRDAQFKGKPRGGQTIVDRMEARNAAKAADAERKKSEIILASAVELQRSVK